MYIDNIKVGDKVIVTYYHLYKYGRLNNKVDYIDKHCQIETVILFNNQLCLSCIVGNIEFVRPIFDNSFYYKILSVKKV